MNPRALLAFAVLAPSVLAARLAAASQFLECKPGASGSLSCLNGKLTLRAADISEANLAAAPADARDIFVAHDRACAVTAGGALSCWGENGSGELGDGTRARRARPVRVRGLDDVTAVALGSQLSCALRRTGRVACWGHDEVTGADRLRPAAVPSLDQVVELAAGSGHACARRQDGSVWCWGWNHYGQLGDGTQKSRRRPVQVAGLADAVELSAGDSHTCARRRDGSVWCWGNGWGGEDGAVDDLLVPAQVKAIRDATALVRFDTGPHQYSGFLALQKDGPLVSCHYHVTGSEASPDLLCRSDKAPSASGLQGTEIVIRRPPSAAP